MMQDVEGFIELLRNDGISVRRVGKEWSLLCPYHDEVVPSLFLNNETGEWYCFGCGEKGNLFKLVQKFGKRVISKDIYYAGGKRGGKIFTLDIDKEVKFYFIGRGFLEFEFNRFIDLFGIRKVEFGKDAFVYFPIRDFEGNDIGWIMRGIREDNSGSKYLLSKGFRAKKYFFGEHVMEVGKVERVIVVEGVFDFLKVFNAGFSCLASLGFAEPNLKIARVIKRCKNLREFILFFDSDVKERDLRKWEYYIKGFGKDIKIIKPDKKDPGEMDSDRIKELLGRQE